MIPRTLLWVIATGCVAAAGAQADDGTRPIEQILSYQSEIVVHPDSTLLVNEQISVNAPGTGSERGIEREFPTRYQDHLGHSYEIHFVIISAERDGQREDYYLEKVPNGLRLEMSESRVPPGPHTYDLTYAVNRELGFFSNHDELYWNVTGNGWALPIQEVSSTVHLPPGIARDAVFLDAYTGPPGAVGSEFAGTVDASSIANFHTTRALGPHEGLTIAVRWPKGFVRPPTDDEKSQYFLDDHRAALIGILGLLVVLIYYTVACFLARRAAAGSSIVPCQEPPRHLSPAAMRYVNRMAFDGKAMAANLVDLAVKNRLSIQEHNAGSYTLVRLRVNRLMADDGGRPEIAPDETLILKTLFADGATMALDPSQRAVVGRTIEALHEKLRFGLEKVYLTANAPYLIPGLVLSLLTVVWCGLTIQGERTLIAIVTTIGLLGWTMACAALTSAALTAWKNVFSDPHHATAARRIAVSTTLFALLGWAVEAVGWEVIVWAASTAVALILVILALTNYLFHYLLKSPRRTGRALIEQIEGFRMFLAAPDGDPYQSPAPTPLTAERFERFLPYAMALNVETAWSEQFARARGQAARSGAAAYAPAWYSGPNWNPTTATAFATAFGGSLAGAITSASAE